MRRSSRSELAVLKETCRALVRVRGEESAASLSSLAARRYGLLTATDKAMFFRFLLADFGPSDSDIVEAITAYQADASPSNAQALEMAATAPRQQLFTAMNTAEGGTACMLAMRADCVTASRLEPTLRPVERDLARLIEAWFNRGFLDLQHIDWDTPAAILEKLIAYEAVHEIRGWDDLRRRLECDRRCFGFFHPALPAEPLIFVEVALTVGLQTSIQAVIDAPRPDDSTSDKPDTAIFYSITNCQAGLAGIPLGSFLLKQVTDELLRSVEGLTRFSTLSPVPGLLRWITETGGGLAPEAVASVLADNAEIDDELREAVTTACADYLVNAKRGTQPLDAVARFHLRNGARLEQINWRGDTSHKGIGESYGLLVNYVYDPSDLADNHEAFVNEHRVTYSSTIAGLLTSVD